VHFLTTKATGRVAIRQSLENRPDPTSETINKKLTRVFRSWVFPSRSFFRARTHPRLSSLPVHVASLCTAPGYLWWAIPRCVSGGTTVRKKPFNRTVLFAPVE